MWKIEIGKYRTGMSVGRNVIRVNLETLSRVSFATLKMAFLPVNPDLVGRFDFGIFFFFFWGERMCHDRFIVMEIVSDYFRLDIICSVFSHGSGGNCVCNRIGRPLCVRVVPTVPDIVR